MRLIDADNVNPSDVFIGTSDFATDARIAVCELLRNQPTVDAVPVVHGRWIPHAVDARKGTMSIDEDVCSVCGKDFLQIRETGCVWNYCPNCGAKMDRERSRE